MKIPSLVRLVLSICAGIILGSAVNMGLILNSSSVIPPPDGADLTGLTPY
ncbi:MAG: hypothetical protein IT266_02855 [Saprospiraceae bacterium]|nr:hypothetical protein [Saprospiraceae bacterium]